jgi:hypothetical protein
MEGCCLHGYINGKTGIMKKPFFIGDYNRGGLYVRVDSDTVRPSGFVTADVAGDTGSKK